MDNDRAWKENRKQSNALGTCHRRRCCTAGPNHFPSDEGPPHLREAAQRSWDPMRISRCFREIAGTGFCIEVGFTYVSTASSDHRFRFHYLDISRQVYIPDLVRSTSWCPVRAVKICMIYYCSYHCGCFYCSYHCDLGTSFLLGGIICRYANLAQPLTTASEELDD